MCSTESEPSTWPRRPERSVITAPRYSSPTVTVTSSIGSSSATVFGVAASLIASEPASWKAMSEESTECDLPSYSVTRRSTIG